MNTATSTQILMALDSAPGEARGLIPALREWIASFSLDRRSRYLSQAADHGDLERRIRVWDESEQAGLRRFQL